MSKSKKSLLEEVPPALRQPLGADLVGSLLVNFLSKEDSAEIGEVIAYIRSAQEYQNLICDEDQEMKKNVRDIGWRWFREKIKDVTVIERKDSNNKVIGRKGHIIFDTVVKDNKGNGSNASIDTGWIEYFGWGKEDLAWEIALSNTIYQTAKANIGKDVSVLKHVWPNDLTKLRQIINIQATWSGKSQGTNDEDEDSDVIEYSKDDVIDALDEIGIEYEKGDSSEIYKILSKTSDISEIKELMMNYLDLSAGDLQVSKDTRGFAKEQDSLMYAVSLLADNV